MKPTRKTMHLGASPAIFKFAQQLRENPTPAEEILWEHLRDRKMENVKFRFQHPLRKYVGDFYSQELKFIVELDGHHHEEKLQKFSDEDRTDVLKGDGIYILRFSNEDVLFRISDTLKKIKEEVQRIKQAKKGRFH